MAVWSFRRSWSRANIRATLPGALAGILLGALTFPYLSESAVKVLVGLVAVVFGLDYWRPRADPVAPAPVSHRKGNFWGMVSGFTSFGIHAGGIPISVYLLPQQLEKKQLMGTFAVFFAVVNVVKLAPYTLLGQFSTENLATSLALMPVAPLGVLFGYRVLTRISQTLVYRLSYGFLVLVGAKLLWEGVAGLA